MRNLRTQSQQMFQAEDILPPSLRDLWIRLHMKDQSRYIQIVYCFLLPVIIFGDVNQSLKEPSCSPRWLALATLGAMELRWGSFHVLSSFSSIHWERRWKEHVLSHLESKSWTVWSLGVSLVLSSMAVSHAVASVIPVVTKAPLPLAAGPSPGEPAKEDQRSAVEARPSNPCLLDCAVNKVYR